MARSEFTVPGPADLDPDLRVQIDTAFDDSGSTVTDVLIGGRVADGSQGFNLRGVGTFLGPDGVDTLYLKSLDYRGRVVGFPVQVAGASSGGSGTLAWLGVHLTADMPDKTPLPDVAAALLPSVVILGTWIDVTTPFDQEVWVGLTDNDGAADYFDIPASTVTGQSTVNIGTIMEMSVTNTYVIVGDASGALFANTGPATTGDAMLWLLIASAVPNP